jgi:hypothetical protein
MTKLGWKNYDENGQKNKTVPEEIASMSDRQKALILEAFTASTPDKQIHPGHWSKWVTETYPDEVAADPSLVDVRVNVVRTLYVEISLIQEYTEKIMLEEDPPTTKVKLVEEIRKEFPGKFDEAQCEAVLTDLIKYSKKNGNGTWTSFRTDVLNAKS